MVDVPPQPATDQPLYSTDSDGRRTMSVNGKVYQVLDIGYLNGNPNTACIVLSEETIIVSPIPDSAPLCAACWHNEGIPLVPDWLICGTPVGGHGMLIKFKQPWICHCLKLMSYQSIETSTIDEALTFTPMCGAPKVAPPSADLAAAAVGAGLLGLGALAFFALVNKQASYSGDVPPGFSTDINVTEESGNNPPDIKCPEDPAGGVSHTNASQNNTDCK